MGCSPFNKSCYTNYNATPPNPSPSRWVLLDKVEYRNGYVLKVKYLDCTNFEGVKIMVYRGTFTPRVVLDPHFSEHDGSPIARFRPDEHGWNLACALAFSL